MHSPSTRVRRQRGLATVEFAICAPILFLMMFATAELGRLLFQYNTLVKAVRDGARYAATAATNSTRVVTIDNAKLTATRNLVVTGNTAGSGTPLLPGLSVNDVNLTNNGNGFISVSATYDYQPMLGAPLPMFGFGDAIDLSMELSAVVIMR
jgi:Flp pilus assembly protein TadG